MSSKNYISSKRVESFIIKHLKLHTSSKKATSYKDLFSSVVNENKFLTKSQREKQLSKLLDAIFSAMQNLCSKHLEYELLFNRMVKNKQYFNSPNGIIKLVDELDRIGVL